MHHRKSPFLLEKTLLAGLFALLTAQSVSAVTYPYVISDPMSATLDVDTAIRVPIDPMQLCVNYDPYDDEGLIGFNAPNHQARFRTINPSGVRWPQGIWANFYDWESDGRRIYDNYTDTFYGAVVNIPHLKYGFDGLHELHDELNFDVLFTWNMCYDSVEKGMARYNDRITKGFDFRWIELGNELFYKDQRSDAILDPQNYPPIARAHSQALKAADPNIMISLPAAWKTFTIPKSFTDAVAADQSYYDAVSLHKYMNGSTLDATGEMESAVNYIRGVYPGKPIWLTEWAVNSSGDNALGVLGTAEIYLYFFNRMEEITMNQNFQVFGGGNFYDSDYNKTSFGACYDIIRSVFADSEMFASVCTSTEIASGLNAVHGEAVERDGETVIFVLNKADASAPFTLKFDGVTYTGDMKHETLTFDDANQFKIFGFTEDPLTTVSANTNSITLPKLSLNVITLLNDLRPAILSEITIEAESAAGQSGFAPYEVRHDIGGATYVTTITDTAITNFDRVVESRGGVASYGFELLQAGRVTIEVSGRFKNTGSDAFWYQVDDGAWIRENVPVGGPWKWVQLLPIPMLELGSHTLKIARRDAGTEFDRFRLTSTDAIFADPRTTVILSGETTRIEAEDYDEGGVGVGYLDRTNGNTGGEYRTDHVDVQTCSDVGGGFSVGWVQAGEWLQYTVDVQQGGVHDLRLRVARGAAGDSALRILVDDQFVTGDLVVSETGGWGNWVDLTTSVNLPKGKHALRVKATDNGFNLNYLEFTSYGLAQPWVQVDVGAVAAAGTASTVNGTFTVTGSGADIYGSSDEFNYVYQPISGDCEIVARVLSIEDTNAWAKAGLMLRESLDAASAHATLSMTSQKGVTFQRRDSVGDSTPPGTTAAGHSAPYWLKLKRAGDVFTGSASSEGINWDLIDTATISMAANVYIGISVTSHDDGTLCTATFDNVSVTTPTTEQENWRLANFGTIDNAGSAADHFDSNNDGENNLLEFTTGQLPNAATKAASPLLRNSVTLEFTYIRSQAALTDGFTFTVEWSETLAPDSWSTVGVSEQVLSDEAAVQTIKATVPAGSSGKRFVHLVVRSTR